MDLGKRANWISQSDLKMAAVAERYSSELVWLDLIFEVVALTLELSLIHI